MTTQSEGSLTLFVLGHRQEGSVQASIKVNYYEILRLPFLSYENPF